MGTVSEALETLWQRHRQPARRLLSWRWRRELVLRQRFSVRPVDWTKVTDEIPRDQVPDCGRCTDLCCGGLENVVSLRLRDLATLIDLGRTDLIARRKPRFPESLLRERPSLRPWIQSTLWRTLPVVEQVGPHRTCAALVQGQCSLYPHWPTSCARFPYTIGEGRLRWGLRCRTPAPLPSPKHASRMRAAAAATYDRRIEDAVLLSHARADLDAIGLGAWLTDPNDSDAWEAPSRLEILDQ